MCWIAETHALTEELLEIKERWNGNRWGLAAKESSPEDRSFIRERAPDQIGQGPCVLPRKKIDGWIWLDLGEPKARKSKRLLVKRQGMNASSLRAKLGDESIGK